MSDNQSTRPPRLPDKFLGWFCDPSQIEIFRGDVYELYEDRREVYSKLRADVHFFLDVLGLCRPYAIKKFDNHKSNSMSMFRNYFKVTYRNLIRQKVYSSLNLSGLAIGLACTLLIFLFINDELSYDRFHEKSDRIYRVLEHFESEGNGEHSASQPFPTGPTLQSEYPAEIAQSVRLFNFQSPTMALANKEKDKAFNESRVFFADSTFLDVFDFELVTGDRETALHNPNSILITSSMSRKYFPNEDPVGKFLELQGRQNLEVVGVLEDSPTNAHFQFDFIISFSSLKQWYGGRYPGSWYWNPCWTYVVLNENITRSQVESHFPDFVEKFFPDFIKEDVTLELQPLADIHLHSRLDYEIEANSNIQSVYIFGAIAIFVLIIAAINFINLSTARATKRAKEVGVRKSLGSSRVQLIRQYVFESVFLTCLSLIAALCIVALCLPGFNALTEKSVFFGVLFQPVILTTLLAITLLIGLLSGLYPAFILSSFNPILVLKNAHMKTSGLNFRKILVTLQFVVSISLIIGTIVAVNQLKFLQNKDTGFDQNNIVMIPVIQSPMGQHYESFRQTALQSTYIQSITAVEEIVGAKHQVGNYQFEGDEQSKPYARFNIRHDFNKTFDIPIVAGRDYDQSIQTDDSLALIVNETMVREMGWGTPEEAVGKRFYFRNELKGKVVGVSKDYNFVSKHHPIVPLVLTLNTRRGAFNLFIKYVAVKVDGKNLPTAIEDLESAWKSVLPNMPFDFFFLDDRLNDSYKAEQKLTSVTVIFSTLTILVACLGLFGLATFSVEQRTKEIGVRKVLGISTPQILVLLSKEFMLLIAVAFIIAIPVSYYFIQLWLNGFSYRIGVEATPYVIAGLLTFLVAFLTVTWHSMKASLINPVDTLKYE
ncbi:MAG: FtsX-like permease family protein [Cyclobacteriaceae bacterium]